MPKSNKLAIVLEKPANYVYVVGERIAGQIRQDDKDVRDSVNMTYSFTCRISAEPSSNRFRKGASADEDVDVFRHTVSRELARIHPFALFVPNSLPMDERQACYDADGLSTDTTSTSWTNTRLSYAPPSIVIKAGKRVSSVTYRIWAGITNGSDAAVEKGSDISVDIRIATPQNLGPQMSSPYQSRQFTLHPEIVPSPLAKPSQSSSERRKSSKSSLDARRSSGTSSSTFSQATSISFPFPDIQFTLVFPAYAVIGHAAKIGCEWKQLSQPDWPSKANITVYLRSQVTEEVCFHWDLCDDISDHEAIATRDQRWTRFCGWYTENLDLEGNASEFEPLRIGKDFFPSFHSKLNCVHGIDVNIKVVAKIPPLASLASTAENDFSKDEAVYTENISHQIILLEERCHWDLMTPQNGDIFSALPGYDDESAPPRYPSPAPELVDGLPAYSSG